MKNNQTDRRDDRASNWTYRHDVVATAQAKLFDELYGYDSIQRLQDMARRVALQRPGGMQRR